MWIMFVNFVHKHLNIMVIEIMKILYLEDSKIKESTYFSPNMQSEILSFILSDIYLFLAGEVREWAIKLLLSLYKVRTRRNDLL